MCLAVPSFDVRRSKIFKAYKALQVDSATREIAEVVFSPDGNFLQDLLIEEGVAAIDALSRASLVRLLRTLGPLALPLALPLNFLLGGADDQQLLSREDKQSLLVLRRITELVDAGRRPAAESDEAADFGETVRSLQRLQPIAQGLLPFPGAVLGFLSSTLAGGVVTCRPPCCSFGPLRPRRSGPSLPVPRPLRVASPGSWRGACCCAWQTTWSAGPTTPCL